ncbi:hypothetical protein ACIQ57_22645 [Lysinibacillus xylanilyticus]|uniref:hypothetical protein n=1 Tax=Lysinibacillus xylanilyticus TaxID=582475 RepID=UPI0038011DCE
MAIKWRNKIERYATISGFVAAVFGLIYFGVFAYQLVNARSSEVLQLLEKIL